MFHPKNFHYNPASKRWDSHTIDGTGVFIEDKDWYHSVMIKGSIVRKGPFRNESEARGDHKLFADQDYLERRK